jgi:PPM family protein phosphatase
MILCTNCQTENRADGKFCVRCGAPLLQSPPQPAYTQPVPAEPTPTSMRPTMPLDETAVPPLLDDYSLPSPPSDAGWDGDVKRLGFPFEPLPEGAFVGQYIVTQVLEGQAGVQRYYVQDEAGTAVYLLKESAEWKALRPEWELIQRGISGEGLRPPLAAFQQRTGTMRYYLLLPPIGSIIGNLSVPVEVPKAINYGVSLARGLAALHAQQIGIGKIDARHIALEGDEAYFCEFDACVVPGQPQQYSQEVQQLATMLYMLLTGQREYASQNSLPPAFQPLFDQLLGQKQPMTAEALAQELTRLSGQMRRPESIDLRVGRLTDVGMVRQLNEDSLCTMELVWNNQSKNIPVGAYVVADGMGGHEGGEIASGLTIKAIMQLAAEELFTPTTKGNAPDYDGWLKKAVEMANTAVYNRSQQSHNDMGTTVVVAVMIGDEVHIAHVGDSRAYHITANAIEQITTDHSLVERLVATGQITREEAQYHPQSNVIYRTIGDKAKIEVDISYAHIAPGEFLLLCSDGLSGMVSDERMQQIVSQAVSPQIACAELIAAANAAGGDDNISVIIVKPEALA